MIDSKRINRLPISSPDKKVLRRLFVNRNRYTDAVRVLNRHPHSFGATDKRRLAEAATLLNNYPSDEDVDKAVRLFSMMGCAPEVKRFLISWAEGLTTYPSNDFIITFAYVDSQAPDYFEWAYRDNGFAEAGSSIPEEMRMQLGDNPSARMDDMGAYGDSVDRDSVDWFATFGAYFIHPGGTNVRGSELKVTINGEIFYFPANPDWGDVENYTGYYHQQDKDLVDDRRYGDFLNAVRDNQDKAVPVSFTYIPPKAGYAFLENTITVGKIVGGGIESRGAFAGGFGAISTPDELALPGNPTAEFGGVISVFGENAGSLAGIYADFIHPGGTEVSSGRIVIDLWSPSSSFAVPNEYTVLTLDEVSDSNATRFTNKNSDLIARWNNILTIEDTVDIFLTIQYWPE